MMFQRLFVVDLFIRCHNSMGPSPFGMGVQVRVPRCVCGPPSLPLHLSGSLAQTLSSHSYHLLYVPYSSLTVEEAVTRSTKMIVAVLGFSVSLVVKEPADKTTIEDRVRKVLRDSRVELTQNGGNMDNLAKGLPLTPGVPTAPRSAVPGMTVVAGSQATQEVAGRARSSSSQVAGAWCGPPVHPAAKKSADKRKADQVEKAAQAKAALQATKQGKAAAVAAAKTEASQKGGGRKRRRVGLARTELTEDATVEGAAAGDNSEPE